MSDRRPDAAERDDRRPSEWTRAAASGIRRTAGTVAPAAGPPAVDPAAGRHVWDAWLLRDRHGRLATVDGRRVLFALTAPADLLPGKRHDVAEIRYFHSADGVDWTPGGPVFDGGALGQRQWAGSALYDDGDLYVYYTAAGDGGAAELTYTQRIAAGHGGRLVATADGVSVEGTWRHAVLLEPDGRRYETQAQSRGMRYTFRDPWFFEDPGTGTTYLLFEGNTPADGDADADADADDGDPGLAFNGSVGVAVSPTGDPLDWELRRPLLTAVGVNQELERPHVVCADGRYYLWVSSHTHTFAPGVDGFDALYGFVADSLRGEYRALNGSGLAVTNPADAPYQSYSWMAYPHDEEVLVQHFLNYHEFDGRSLDAIADLPPDEQRRRFGGTLGPTIRLAVNGATARVHGTLAHWRLPTPDEPLPPVDSDGRPPEDAALEPRDAGGAGSGAGSDRDRGRRRDQGRGPDYWSAGYGDGPPSR